MELAGENDRGKIPPGTKTKVGAEDFSDLPKVVVWKLMSPNFAKKLGKVANIVTWEEANDRGYADVLYVLDCEASDSVLSLIEDCRRLMGKKPLIRTLIAVSLPQAIKYHNQLQRAGCTGIIEIHCLDSVLAEAVQMTSIGTFFCDPDLVAFGGYKP